MRRNFAGLNDLAILLCLGSRLRSSLDYKNRIVFVYSIYYGLKMIFARDGYQPYAGLLTFTFVQFELI